MTGHRISRTCVGRSRLLVLAGLLLVGCAEPVAIRDCAAGPNLDVICDFTKPEDLALLPGTDWLLISELGDSSSSGHVAAWHLGEQRLQRLQPTAAPLTADYGFPVCGPPPADFKPRGFHLSQVNQEPTLLVVNAGTRTRIERYRVLTGPTPALVWQGCVHVPDHITPNDVAALPSGGFVVSHMFTPPRTRLLDLQFLLGLATGYAARWDAGTGWRAVPGSEASFPNGIETDPDTGRIFLAATYGQDLTAVDPDGGNRRRTALPLQPDNLTWGPDGRLLAAGHTGVPILGTRGCRELSDAACAFPFAVAAIDPASLAVETIYAHSEGRIPGPSVALQHAGKLYLGTFFGDRISVVTPATGR